MEPSPAHTLFTVAEVDLIYRNKVSPNDRPKITSSSNAYDILLQAWDMNKIELIEQFIILLLDRNNQCLGLSKVATGGYYSCLIDPKVVFATALKTRASGIILAHNHPSGNIQPSQADKDLTGLLKKGGELLQLNILDHLIVTPHNYYSFSDEGMMPS